MARKKESRGRLKTRVTWTTGGGLELELHEMSDFHIINTIAYLQAKKERLERTEYECNAVDNSIKDIDDNIQAFVDEMNRRDSEGGHIEVGYYE